MNTNGVWTSREGIYLEYDSNTRRLYFPDGSFWVFDCLSSGKEEDAGALYPTLMQDTNGNQVKTRYLQGEAAPWGDTSARIRDVEDVRSAGNYTYFSSSSADHLSSVANTLGTALALAALRYDDPAGRSLRRRQSGVQLPL